MTLAELRDRVTSRPAAFLCGVLVGAAFALWRPASAVRREEKESVQATTHATETIAMQQRTSLEQQATQAVQADRNVRVTVARREKTRKDGTRTLSEKLTVEGREHSATSAVSRTEASSVAAVAEARTVVQEVERVREVRVTPVLASWRVQALGGLDVRGALEHRTVFVYGGSLERRIMGPLWLGLWATSAGQGGVSVAFEF